MHTDAQVRDAISTEPAMKQSVGTTMELRFADVEAVRRSEANILNWMEYLPEDCIRRMIEMEWDITT